MKALIALLIAAFVASPAWAADTFILGSEDVHVDATTVTTTEGTVVRQRIVVCDDADGALCVEVTADGFAVVGPLTDAELRATPVPVSGPLTDAQLRATAVPVSGTVTATQGTAAAGSGAWPVAVTDTSNTVVKPGDAGNNAVRVNVVAGAGSGGTASTDDAAFTAGSGSGTPMMGFVTSDSVDSGDVGTLGMLANRQLKVTLFDSAGDEVGVGGGTQYDQGTATTDTDKLTLAGCVRADTAAVATGVANGDRARCIVDATGNIWVRPTLLTPSGDSLVDDTNDALRTSVVTVVTTQGKTHTTEEFTFTASQTNVKLVTASSNQKVRVSRYDFMCTAATSVAVKMRLGFAASTLPSEADTGAVGVFGKAYTQADTVTAYLKSLNATVEGALDDDVIITMGAPTSGECTLILDYEIIG